MNQKLLVFDIDDTLCDINEPIYNDLVKALQTLAKAHYISFASGKPTAYLAGMSRQLNIKNAILVGENGATIMYGSIFPPKDYYKVKLSNNVKDYLNSIKKAFREKFKNEIWFQPNEVNLTIFPFDINKLSSIHGFARKFETDFITIYYHRDSVDFIPKGFDKGSAVKLILQQLKIKKEDLYVFGNSHNDIPMLKLTKNSFLIKNKLYKIKPFKVFTSYEDLTTFLQNFN